MTAKKKTEPPPLGAKLGDLKRSVEINLTDDGFNEDLQVRLVFATDAIVELVEWLVSQGALMNEGEEFGVVLAASLADAIPPVETER